MSNSFTQWSRSPNSFRREDVRGRVNFAPFRPGGGSGGLFGPPPDIYSGAREGQAPRRRFGSTASSGGKGSGPVRAVHIPGFAQVPNAKRPPPKNNVQRTSSSTFGSARGNVRSGSARGARPRPPPGQRSKGKGKGKGFKGFYPNRAWVKERKPPVISDPVARIIHKNFDKSIKTDQAFDPSHPLLNTKATGRSGTSTNVSSARKEEDKTYEPPTDRYFAGDTNNKTEKEDPEFDYECLDSPKKLSRCNSESDLTRLQQEYEEGVGVGKLVRFHSLKARADLNGKTGVVEMYTSETQERVQVFLHEPIGNEERVSVRVANCELAPDAALVHGTPKDQFHLNVLEEITASLMGAGISGGFGDIGRGA